jgi:hypothetical protein
MIDTGSNMKDIIDAILATLPPLVDQSDTDCESVIVLLPQMILKHHCLLRGTTDGVVQYSKAVNIYCNPAFLNWNHLQKTNGMLHKLFNTSQKNSPTAKQLIMHTQHPSTLTSLRMSLTLPLMH